MVKVINLLNRSWLYVSYLQCSAYFLRSFVLFFICFGKLWDNWKLLLWYDLNDGRNSVNWNSVLLPKQKLGTLYTVSIRGRQKIFYKCSSDLQGTQLVFTLRFGCSFSVWKTSYGLHSHYRPSDWKESTAYLGREPESLTL